MNKIAKTYSEYAIDRTMGIFYQETKALYIRLTEREILNLIRGSEFVIYREIEGIEIRIMGRGEES